MVHNIGDYKIETSKNEFILKKRVKAKTESAEEKFKTIGHLNSLDKTLTAIINQIMFDNKNLEDIVKKLEVANSNILDIKKKLNSIGSLEKQED